MVRKSPLRRKSCKRAKSFLPGERRAIKRLVPQKPKPTYVLMAEIRKGLGPPDLLRHIKQIAERGSPLHIKYFRCLLERYPKRKESRDLFYGEVRQALLDGIKKLQKKYKTK